jgi:hypothetical protein
MLCATGLVDAVEWRAMPNDHTHGKADREGAINRHYTVVAVGAGTECQAVQYLCPLHGTILRLLRLVERSWMCRTLAHLELHITYNSKKERLNEEVRISRAPSILPNPSHPEIGGFGFLRKKSADKKMEPMRFVSSLPVTTAAKKQSTGSTRLFWT